MLSKNEALQKIQKRIDEIQGLKTLPDLPFRIKKWRRDTEVTIEKVFGQKCRHLNDFTKPFFIFDHVGPSRPDALDALIEAQTILQSFITEIDEHWRDEPKPTPRNTLGVIKKICERFHLVSRQLRSRHADRETLCVEDEYDVQDLFHALLTLEFDDIRPEEWTPSYAGSSSRTDFLLKQEKIVIEIKKTRKDLGAKQVGEQLIIDIQRYKAHPDCQSLVCFVYDPEGRIANPRGIENDLNGSGNGMDVKVIIAPRGI